MKPFSVKDYLANPSRKVVTREGKQVRIVCTDAMSEYPIIALVRQCENTENMCNFTKDGTYVKGEENGIDLFFAPEKKWGWTNVYKEGSKNTRSAIFDTKEEATRFASREDYVDTIRIEWEE